MYGIVDGLRVDESGHVGKVTSPARKSEFCTQEWYGGAHVFCAFVPPALRGLVFEDRLFICSQGAT